MSTEEIIGLLILSTVASFTPGPNTTLSMAIAANHGLKSVSMFICSIAVGWTALLSISAGGLASLVFAVPIARESIKFFGVIYLCWLAYKITQTRPAFYSKEYGLIISFRQGVAFQFLNIKAWMLTLAVASGWLIGHDNILERNLIIFPVLIGLGILSNFLYALMGALIKGWLQGQEKSGKRIRIFNNVMSAVFLLTAVWLATF